MSEPASPGALESAADAPAQNLTPATIPVELDGQPRAEPVPQVGEVLGEPGLPEGMVAEAPAEPAPLVSETPAEPCLAEGMVGEAPAEPCLPEGVVGEAPAELNPLVGVVPDELAGPESAHGLSPEAVESILADFRSWLLGVADVTAPEEAPTAAPDLSTLLGQFVALRHEVNLQTKATRGQQEQTANAVELLRKALDRLDQAAAAEEASSEEALRPLLKTLVDLYDALALAGREVQKGQDGLGPLLGTFTTQAGPGPVGGEAPSEHRPSISWWRRLFGGGAAAEAAEVARLRRELAETRHAAADNAARASATAERVRQVISSLVTGYGMSLQRVERAIRQHGLEAIAAVGTNFDPERMEVVEAVSGSGKPSGEVVEEVRRGYMLNDRVFRYAQVRVAKG